MTPGLVSDYTDASPVISFAEAMIPRFIRKIPNGAKRFLLAIILSAIVKSVLDVFARKARKTGGVVKG